ncbi:MAG: SCP2 sterol-binding domain-containing protein [Deltaproteobacteria bacterium]|nr:SCP2 sterol-binding domain-containing protein [Deltaproteobacteria bacterium]
MMRDLRARYMVPLHTRPVTEKKKIYDILTNYRDAIQFVHDQTIRWMNKGLTPDEIVERVKLPDHLARQPYLYEYYGTVPWSVRGIFAVYLGWFGGNATDLFPLAPKELAQRFARLAGGDKVTGFRFPDTGEAYTLHVRRGVAEVRPRFPENPDMTVTVDAAVWKEIAAGMRSPAGALIKGDVRIEGGTFSLVKFLGLFKDD